MNSEIEYVMMRRTTDGDGPHPIHPAEVSNYMAGDWVVVENSIVPGKEAPKDNLEREAERLAKAAARTKAKAPLKAETANSDSLLSEM